MEEKFRREIAEIMKHTKIAERNNFIYDQFKSGKSFREIERLVIKKFTEEIVCGYENIRLLCKKQFKNQYDRGRYKHEEDKSTYYSITRPSTIERLEELRRVESCWKMESFWSWFKRVFLRINK